MTGTTASGADRVPLRAQAWAPRLALAVLAWVAAPAQADEHRTQVEQRVALTARLLADSSTTQRIAGSGIREAALHLESGRVHHALAAEALRRGVQSGSHLTADATWRLGTSHG